MIMIFKSFQYQRKQSPIFTDFMAAVNTYSSVRYDNDFTHKTLCLINMGYLHQNSDNHKETMRITFARIEQKLSDILITVIEV